VNETTQTNDTIVAGQLTYRIIKPIGAGGMGQVFLVQAPDRAEPIALKFLSAGMMSETRIAAFKREFSLLAELHHPHVCRVFDFGFSSSHRQYFFTAEFVEGEDLFRALLQAPIDEVETVIAQILSALEFVHSVGLIHFDIKGDNLLVSRQHGRLHATLVDFGVTSPAGQPLKEIAGTLYYMAPELLNGQSVITHRADLYSLGVACYRLLAGVYPYEVQTLEAAKEWHRTQKLDLEPLQSRGVPEYLCQMIARLMATDPEERFSSARVVLNFLSLYSHTKFLDLPVLQRAQLAEGPLVGREGPLATIRNAIGRMVRYTQVDGTVDQEEHPQTYLVVGGRGLGKSRLLKEMKSSAQLEECATWLVDGEREGRDLANFLGAFGQPVGDTPPSPDVAGEHLLQAAQDRATCYLIDNFDRASPAVQKTILALLGRLYSATLAHTAPPLIVVVAFSPDSSTAPRATGAASLELQALSREEVQQYITQLVGAHEDLSDFTNAVWNFSNGVPFLMAEAARRYHHDTGALPDSIEELYHQQIAKVSPAARELLECLSLARAPLSPGDLQMIQGAIDEVALHELRLEGLIRFNPADDTAMTVTGALAETVKQGLTPQRRQHLADRLLEWVTSDAAHHAIDATEYVPFASDHVRAIEILRNAAHTAETQGEGERAVELLRRTEEIMTQQPALGADLTAVRRKLATLFLYQGKYQACEEMLHSISAAGPPEVEELKMLGLIRRAQRRPKEAGEICDQALSLLGADPSNPTFLFLQNERAQSYLEEGAVPQAIDLYQQSHAWAKQLDAAKQAKVTNNNLGVALARVGKFDEALAFYHDKLAMHGHDKRIVASIYGQLGVIYLHAGRADDALKHFSMAWQRSLEMGTQHNALALLDNIIVLLQKKAAYSDALEYAQQAFQIKAAGGTDTDLARSLLTVAQLYLNLGVPDLSARYLTQAMRLARKSRSHQSLGWIHMTFGYLYKDLGRLMEAINAFEETISIGENNHDEGLVRWGCYGVVDLLVENGELEEAKPYLQQLQPLMASETDPEFRCRYAILSHKIEVLQQPHPGDHIGPLLLELAASCVAQAWTELHWEVEYLIGVYHHKRDELEAALQHVGTAHAIITTIAQHLGEEFRRNFTRQRSRAKVIVDMKTLSRAHQRAMASSATSAYDQSTDAGNKTVAGQTNPSGVAAPDSAVLGGTNVVPRKTNPPAAAFRPNTSLADLEREILASALQYFHGDLSQTAQSLGITPQDLAEKIDAYGLTASSNTL